MDMVNNLIQELENTEEAFNDARLVLMQPEPDETEYIEASQKEFECFMVLSGATEDLSNMANRLEKQSGNAFLVKRLRDEAEKYRKYEVAL